MNDVFDMGAAPSGGNLVEMLREACQEAVDLDATISGYEAAIAAARSRLHTLRTIKIPEAMAEAGVGDIFSLDSGHVIQLSQFVSGSLPKDPEPRKKALDLLVEIGGEALIKETLTLLFAKGEHDAADELAQELKSRGLEPERKMDVNAMSLQSFAREKLKEGEEIELDALGLYAGTVAKFKAPKEKK